MKEELAFEIMPFEAEAFEAEYEGGAAARPFVSDFSGPAAECVRSLRRAGKTRAQALAIINAQIGVAIKMLRKAAADLKRGSRTQATKDLFLKIFRVRPEFVPTWLKTTTEIKDRGDVVRIRCARVADLLASGRIKFFCEINATNCPDCIGEDIKGAHACSSFGNDRVICLGLAFWDDMRSGRTKSNLSTLMHEPFHIYFGRYVTEHISKSRPKPGKFGGVNCILRFVFEANSRIAPPRVNSGCKATVVRQELETSWS
jgi:hypothetical protein